MRAAHHISNYMYVFSMPAIFISGRWAGDRPSLLTISHTSQTYKSYIYTVIGKIGDQFVLVSLHLPYSLLAKHFSLQSSSSKALSLHSILPVMELYSIRHNASMPFAKFPI